MKTQTPKPEKIHGCRIVRFVPYYGRFLQCGERSVTISPTHQDYGTIRYKGSVRRVIRRQGNEWTLLKEEKTEV